MFPSNPATAPVLRNPSVVNNRNRGRTLLGIFSSVHTIREITEPVILLILDLLTVVLLGLTFCVQSVSVVISVDNVISGLCKALSRNLAGVIASFPLFIPSESERKAISNSLVSHFLNIFWVLIAYKMNLETYFSFFSSFFYLYFAFLNAFLSIYIVKNEIQFLNVFWNRFILYSLLILTTISIVYQISFVSSKAAPVLILLLKIPINNVFLGLELLVKLFSNGDDDITVTSVTLPTLPISTQQQEAQGTTTTTQIPNQSFLLPTSNHGYNDFDNNNLCCLLEILRLSLWTFISVYQYAICVNPLPASLSANSASSSSATLNTSSVSSSEINMTDSILHTAAEVLRSTTVTATPGLRLKSFEFFNARKDRWFYFLLLFHDFINLSIPLKRFSLKVIKDSIISTQFPKLTSEELSSLPADDRCSVCLCDHNTSSVRLPCSHILHQQCLNRILQDGVNSFSTSRCPICRTEIATTTASSSASGTAASLLLNDSELAMLADLLGGGNGGTAARGASGSGPTNGNNNNNNNNNNNGTNEIATFRLRDIIRIRIITPATTSSSNSAANGNNNNGNGNENFPATTPTVPLSSSNNDRTAGNQPDIAIIRPNVGTGGNMDSEGLSNRGVIRISVNLSDLASGSPLSTNISRHSTDLMNNGNNGSSVDGGNSNGNGNNDRVFFRRIISQPPSAPSTFSSAASSSQSLNGNSGNDAAQYIRLNFSNVNPLSSTSLSSLLSAVVNDFEGSAQPTISSVAPLDDNSSRSIVDRNAVTAATGAASAVNRDSSSSSSSTSLSVPMESENSEPVGDEHSTLTADEDNHIPVSTSERRNLRRKRSILQVSLPSPGVKDHTSVDIGMESASKRRKKTSGGGSVSENDESEVAVHADLVEPASGKRNRIRNTTHFSPDKNKPSTNLREDALVNDSSEKQTRGRKRKHSVKEE
jgi:hypothetical protein